MPQDDSVLCFRKIVFTCCAYPDVIQNTNEVKAIRLLLKFSGEALFSEVKDPSFLRMTAFGVLGRLYSLLILPAFLIQMSSRTQTK